MTSGTLLRTAVANTVVSQVLPPGAVKGGAAMKFRLGHANTRFTTDLDVARRDSLNTFVAELEESLRAGWGDFTGRVVPRQPPRPLGVPAAYIMRPYEIRMAFKHGSWCTVHLELGHDEIGDTGDAVPSLADDLVELFAILGLPRPAAVPVLAGHHQIAQKLHACTEAGSDRAHDLVDLQLLVAADQPDLVVVAETARRLFISRNAQAWPPHIRTRPTWPELYEAAAVDLDVLPDLEAAVDWANNLILAIDAARPGH